jgi:hypothetical protein
MLVLAFAAPAAADTFCVPTGSCAPDHTFATLQTALGQANGNGPGRDTIMLGAYTDTTPATNSAGFPVDIIGLGDSTLLLGGGSNSTRLKINEPTSTVRNLQVQLNANDSTGIESAGTVRDVAVSAVQGATQTLVGVLLFGSATLDGAGVFMPTTAGADSTGVRIESPPAGTKTINDVTVEGTDGILSTGGGAGSITNVRDAFVRAHSGLSANNSYMSVDNAVVEVLSGAAGGLTSFAFTESASMRARHVTVVGPGDDPVSHGISASDQDGGPLTATAEVSNSIITGFPQDVHRDGPAVLKIDWSRFATTGPLPPSGANNTSAPPGFLDPGARDFRLAAGSPLIDAGDPAGLAAGEPTADLNRSPRLVDGDGDCTARQDMGAFERQPGQRAPTKLTVAAAPGSAQAGQAVGFSATACDPDDDPLAYSWSFDDGTTAAGASVSKAFATGGTHVGTVTVSDPGGRSAIGSATVEVAPPVVPPLEILSFTMQRTTFAVASAPTATDAARRKPRRGSAFRFELSGDAAVTITIQSLEKGRIRKGKCVKPTPRLRRAKRCTRVRTRGVLHRSGKAGANDVPFSGRIGKKPLSPGRYRAVLAAEGAEKSRSVRFKIVKRR